MRQKYKGLIDKNAKISDFWNLRIMVIPVILLFMLLAPALAHAPSHVTLAYDDLNQTLNVTVTHTSTNPTRHYVSDIVVEKNGIDILNNKYTNQTASNFSHNYLINATEGDVLKATAECSISGSRSAEITLQ